MPSARTLVQQFSDLKTLPHVAIRVTQLMNSDSATIQDFEEVIKLDPVLVVRMLKLVNSPYFGLVNKVESISKAVVYIGMKNLRNLVAIEAIRSIFQDAGDDQGFSREKLWKHSATVAILSKMIAERIFGLAGEDEFLAGIMHDIGLIIEDQVAGDLLRQACSSYAEGDKIITHYEERFVETNHCRVGSALVLDWHMPEEVVQAIKKHHDHDNSYPIPGAVSIVQIAEYIANRMEYGVIKGHFDPLPSYLSSHMKSRMADYKVLIKDLPSEIAKANELYDNEG